MEERGNSVELTDHHTFPTELVDLDQLQSHPRNYRADTEEEIEHLMESIRTHGFYRNIVLCQDGTTILAGHRVVTAARRLGYKKVPAIRTDYERDDPRALKLLIGDNEISHLAEVDDRALTELLRELKDVDELLGTGYDEMMLANLVMVSRPASEIADMDEAAEWVGLPEYDMGENRIQIIVNFATEEDRKEFCRLLHLDISKIGTKGVEKSIWWPMRGDNDNTSLRFVSQGGGKDG
jgi:hypothetical protein